MYTIVIAFIGMGVFNIIDPSLTIPYTIIVGAYIIGEAINNNQKR